MNTSRTASHLESNHLEMMRETRDAYSLVSLEGEERYFCIRKFEVSLQRDDRFGGL